MKLLKFASLSPFFLLQNAYNSRHQPFSHYLLPDQPLSYSELQSRKKYILDNLNLQLGSQQSNLNALKISIAIYDSVESDSIQDSFDLSTIRSYTIALYTYISSLDQNISQLNNQQILEYYQEFCKIIYDDIDDDYY